MKKFYLLFALLLSFAGVTQVMAQDDETVVLEISKKTGNWTASGSPAYASEYATANYSAEEATPGVRIQHWDRGGGHRNNMYFYDGTNLGIYSAFGSTVSEDYRIYPSKGWYVYGISLDFIPGKHPNFAMNGVRVWAYAEESEAVTSPDADTPGHFEYEGYPEDEAYIALTVGQLEEGGNPIFAWTYNFTVTLKRMDPLIEAFEELTALVDKYDPYTEEGANPFVVGDEPGNYNAEAVEAFNQAIVDALNLELKTNVTVDEVKDAQQAIIDAYEAVLATKAPLTLADGYYRFRTGINYNDGNDKYMYITNDNGTFTGRWGTMELEETEPACQSLFKVTNTTGGLFDIVNMATDGRFNNVTGNPVTMSLESQNMMVFEPVCTLDGETYVQIRVSTQEADNYYYIHQAGHSSGGGTGGTLTAWSKSYPAGTSNKMGGSEWVIEAVNATEAEAIIAEYAPIKEQKALVADFNALLAEANNAVKEAKDIQEYTNLITDNSQFSSPWTEPSEGSLDNLLDGNASTFWHSAWSAGNVPNHTHYLVVELAEPVSELVQLKITRRPVSNDHITLWGVFGSNEQDVEEVLYTEDDEEVLAGDKEVGDVKVQGVEAEWTELASLSTPYGNNTETITSQDFDTQGFKFLRFYIDGTTTGRGYGHISEFQLVVPVPNEKSQFAYMGEVATNLDALLKQLNKLSDEDITQEKYDALVDAYEAFKAEFVDPTELRELLASVEGIANGVVVGTQPGYWKDASTGEALKETYAAAKAYDEDGVYAASKSNEFIATLKAQAQAVNDAVIGIEEGKWYRIHFGSKEVFEENEWDVENNEASVSHEIETNEALWDKFITVAKASSSTESVQVLDETTGESSDVTVTINYVEPFDDADEVRQGANLFLDADEDIQDKSFSLFRFVNVGDTAYALQNKATGLFVKAAGTSGAVTLSITPSLFNVKAIGYGQNLIAASNLITGANQNNLHAQRAGNQVVTYSESAPGSRSGLYIDDAGEVEATYDGSEFKMDVVPGEIYSICYPVDLTVDEGEGQFYIATEVEVGDEEVQVTLSPIVETNMAGCPVFYINGDPKNYLEDASTEVVTLKHGTSFVTQPVNAGFMRGTFAQEVVGKGFIVTGGNLRDYLGQHASDEKRNEFYITSQYITNAVVANGAYIATEELLNDALTVTFELGDEEVPTAIANAIKNVSRQGDIYTIDGRLLHRNGNLNDLKKFGKGIYILNGAKVVVK